MLDDSAALIPLVWRRVKIPSGLSGILELIAREVLRENPECIYSFAAKLLEKEIRKQSGPSEKHQPDEKDAGKGSVNPVNEETRLLCEDDNNSEPTSQAGEVVVRKEESQLTEVETEPTIAEHRHKDLTSPNSREDTETKAFSGQDTAQNEARKEMEEDGEECEDEEDADDAVKNVDYGLDTTEIEKLIQSGDYKSVSVTMYDSDQEGSEEQEDEQSHEEEDADRDEDNNNAHGDFEDLDSSEYEHMDDNVNDIISSHMDDSKSDQELNDAAVKIQAGFRGYKARKNLRERKETANNGSRTATDEEGPEKDKVAVNPLRPETEEEGSESDRFQAPLPRRRPGNHSARESKYRSGMVFGDDTSDNDNPSSEEILALGLDDEYLNKAATRIQANVRGWMTRKQFEKERLQAVDRKQAATRIQATVRGFLTRRRLAKARSANRRRSSHGSSLINRRRSSLKPDVAATRIQAVFRGYNVRKTKPSAKKSTLVESGVGGKEKKL